MNRLRQLIDYKILIMYLLLWSTDDDTKKHIDAEQYVINSDDVMAVSIEEILICIKTKNKADASITNLVDMYFELQRIINQLVDGQVYSTAVEKKIDEVLEVVKPKLTVYMTEKQRTIAKTDAEFAKSLNKK